MSPRAAYVRGARINIFSAFLLYHSTGDLSIPILSGRYYKRSDGRQPNIDIASFEEPSNSTKKSKAFWKGCGGTLFLEKGSPAYYLLLF